MIRNLRLGVRISLIIGLVVLAAFAVTTTVISTTAGDLARRESFKTAQRMASQYANEVDALLEVGIDSARTLAQSFEGLKRVGIADRVVGNAMLREVLERTPEYIGVWTCWEPNAFDGKDSQFVNRLGSDGTGRYVPYWNRGGGAVGLEPLLGYEDEKDGLYYLLAKRSGEETITPPYVYKVRGEDVLMVSLVVPVHYRDAFVGVCGVDIPLDKVQALVSQFRPEGTGYAALLSYDGRYAAHRDVSQINADIGSSSDHAAFKKATMEGREVTSIRPSTYLRGEEVYTALVPIRVGNTKTPWSFIVNIPMRTILAPANRIRNLVIAIGALSTVGLCGLVYYLSARLVTRPISTVTGVAQQIAEGDLREAGRSLAECKSVEKRREDEVGRMLGTFETMNESLSALARQVQVSVVQVTSSSTEIAASARELEATATEQAASAQEVTASSRQISVTAEQLARTMEGVDQSLAETVTLAQTGRSGLDGMEKVMHNLIQATSVISSSLAAINDKACRISDVVTAINRISDRTNLLSLNASIEAEKAAEYGKGFSVVAREIRRLADQTSVATQDIEVVIKDMQSAVATGVMQMDKFADDVRKSAEEVEQIAGQLGSIIGQVRALGPRFGSVTEGMHHQADSAQQISEAMDQLALTASQTKDALAEFKQATGQLTLASQGLQKEVSRFSVEA